VPLIFLTNTHVICESCSDKAHTALWNRRHAKWHRLLGWFWRPDWNEELLMLRAMPPGLVIGWWLAESLRVCCVPASLSVAASAISLLASSVIMTLTLMLLDGFAGRNRRTGFVLWASVWALAGAWSGRLFPTWGLIVGIVLGIALWTTVDRYSTRQSESQS
jgi:hypothetical protein